MTLARIGISTGIAPRSAAREAVEAAGVGSRRVDAALVFATTAWGPQLGELLDEVAGGLDAEVMAGASVAGLFAAGRGTAQNPGLAVLTLSDIRAEGILLDGLRGAEEGAAAELLERLSAPPGPEDLVLFFADSVGLLPESTFAGVGEILAPSLALGLGASALPGAGPRVWCGGEPCEGALAGFVLRGVGRPRWGVAQVGRAVSEPQTVTRSRDHWIKALDDRPASQVFEEVARSCGIADSRQARRYLVASIGPGPAGSGSEANDHDLRDVVGLDPRRGSLALPHAVPVGSKLTFYLQDEVATRENLENLIVEQAGASPLFGLYLAPEVGSFPATADLGATARCLQDGFPDAPILGLQGAYPLASLRDPADGCRALSHSSLLALIER